MDGLQLVLSKTNRIGDTIDNIRATLHLILRELVTIALQALSLVEKAELVQVHFTIRLRDQWCE